MAVGSGRTETSVNRDNCQTRPNKTKLSKNPHTNAGQDNPIGIRVPRAGKRLRDALVPSYKSHKKIKLTVITYM